jgi:hypothetical protein
VSSSDLAPNLHLRGRTKQQQCEVIDQFLALEASDRGDQLFGDSVRGLIGTTFEDGRGPFGVEKLIALPGLDETVGDLLPGASRGDDAASQRGEFTIGGSDHQQTFDLS